MSKYKIYSGKEIMTVTPFGLLMDLIINNKVTIYLHKTDGNTYQYSLDGIIWEILNRKLGKDLYKKSNYCKNIIILEDYLNEEKD